MPTQLQLRRGNTSQHSTFTGAAGEITVDTEKNVIVVHDGSTAGGTPLAKTVNQAFTGNTQTSNLSVSGTLTVAGTVNTNIIPSADVTYSLGNTTNRWANLYLSGNTIVLGDQTISANSSGLNLSGALYVDNTEIANATNFSLGDNVAITTSDITVGNSSVNSVLDATSLTTTTVTANDAAVTLLSVGNSSVNSVINSSSITVTDMFITGNLSVTGTQTVLNTQTLTVNDNIIVLNNGWDGAPSEDVGLEVDRGDANTVSLIWDESEDKWSVIVNDGTTLALATNSDVTTAYTNATSYASNADNISSGTVAVARLPVGNSSSAGILQVLDSTSNTSDTIAASANSVKVAFDAAGNAYSNATSFAANADNISSGTLDTARLPATANVSTAINVGANVNLTTSDITVGNTTVNSVINSTSLSTGSITANGEVALQDNLLSRAYIKDYALTVNALGSLSANSTINLEDGNYVTATIAASLTLAFSNPPASGRAGGFILELTNGGAGTVTWPTAVNWPAGTAPTLTASGVDVLVFVTNDGGTTWRGAASMIDSKVPA